MEDLKKIIGKNISILRKTKKLTQSELANKLNYSDKAISKWENGDSLPDVETIYEVANFFGVEIDYLVREHKPEETNQFMLPKDNLRNKLIITLLSVMVVWMFATISYVYGLSILKYIDSWKFFVYAIPVSCILLIVFNKLWGRRIYGFIIISIMCWSILASVYLHFLSYNFWMIFIIGVPVQIAIILWSQFKTKK